MEAEDCSLWHHLIFFEELKSDGNNQVDCWLCKKAVVGCPGYKCLECNFHQHKSCPELQPHTKDAKIEHYLSERHHLIFVEKLDGIGNNQNVCLGCGEPVVGPAYKCSIPKCTILLHKPCSELSRVIKHTTHPDHTLILQVPSKYNRCDICRKNCSGSFFYRCFNCDFDIDIKCVSRWRISAEDCHQHTLFPMRKQMQFTCEACAEESKGIAYQCSDCRVLIHRKCALFPHTIKTLTHEHSLTRTYSLHQDEQRDNICCKLCNGKVNTEYTAYSCQKCCYNAHLNCAYGVQELTPSVDGLVHLVEGINPAVDGRATPQEIKHFSHPQHNLILSSNKELIADMRCEACMRFIISSALFYRCAQCNFFLHDRCAELKRTIKRGLFHEHRLTLFSQAQSMGGLFKCNACKCYRQGFTYKCDKCGPYNLDVQCCLIPKSIKHEGHQHSLFLIKRYFLTCKACGAYGVNFECTFCYNFTLCIRCVTLPLVARYEDDTHLLKLSYRREDNFREGYCLICEEEIDSPDHWFYCCDKCKFTAHPRCVLGENPCIQYGRTFIAEGHEHPLTIVKKNKHFPPCDVCNGSFADMMIKCTQCKFKVHWYCLKRLIK